MRRIIARAFAIGIALLPLAAFAQQFPYVPGQTVIGRNSTTAGPAQAIPFSTLGNNLYGTQSANKVLAGPPSGVAQFPSFRALVGADLPAPGATSLGGVRSTTPISHQFLNQIDTGGLVYQSQPSFADISGQFTSSQCVDATSSAVGCVKPDNTTITISGGVLTAVSSGATSIDAAGATSVTNCGTANAGLVNTSSNKVGCIAGQWQLLASLSANNANVSDTTHLTSTYNEYEIVLKNMIPTTANQYCVIMLQEGGSFQTTGYLNSMLAFSPSSPTAFGPTTFIPCSYTGAASLIASTPGISGSYRIKNPAASNVHPLTISDSISAPQSTSAAIGLIGAGYFNTSGPITGFEICMSTSNATPNCSSSFSSGTVEIYGRL